MLNIISPIIVLICLYNVKAGNILAVFPTPSLSPQHIFSSLIQGLLEHGHEITLITANEVSKKHQASENITTIDLYNKLNRVWQKYHNIMTSDQNRDVVSDISINLQTLNYLFEEILQTIEMKQLIKEKHSHFDLLLLEASIIPLLSLSHIFKAPVILVSSIGAVLDNYEIVGAPTHPFLYPSIFQRRIYNLTAWEKLKEISTNVRLKLKIMSSERNIELILKRHVTSDFPTINKLKGNVYAIFLNSNPIWAGNQPVSSNVVFMGGLQPNNTEELSKDLESFLDKSRNGVIYISFGSNIKPSQLPPKTIIKILLALSEISYDVLLKWDNNRLPGAPKNVKIYKWLPQASLLAHPKTKLFITQGGIQSTFEAINTAVPLIGIPIYADHWYNTEKYIHFHIGIQMDLASLTEDKLTDAINVVMTDESYRTSISELRALMFGQPDSPLKRAVWWTEQVLRPYRIKHLRAPTANMSWAEYLELDFVFFMLLFVFVTMLVLIILITLIMQYLLESISEIKKKIS